MNLKPFDLERALAGEPVISRNGRKITEIFHFKTAQANYSVRVVMDGILYDLTVNGNFDFSGKESENDLFMAPVKREEWVNVYQYSEPLENTHMHRYKVGFSTWNCLEKAEQAGKEYQEETAGSMIYIKSVLIREWEE